ncbi:hypothetical protein Ancab_017479 [Ancistrocladus abbreviatus]
MSSMNFHKRPAGCTMDEFDESKKTELPISMPYPIMKNSMNRNIRAEAKFLMIFPAQKVRISTF